MLQGRRRLPDLLISGKIVTYLAIPTIHPSFRSVGYTGSILRELTNSVR